MTTPKPDSLVLDTVPDYIAAEVFLENSGFFTPSSNRIKTITRKRKLITVRAEGTSEPRVIAIEINANAKYGLPITSDLDYYRAFLKICDEIVDADGRFPVPVPVPTKRILSYAGKTVNQRGLGEVKDWMKRMTATLIEGAMYHAGSGSYDDQFVGVVFSQVVLSGESLRNGRKAGTNYVWPSPWFLSNYYYRHLRPIDHNLHLHLRRPISKSLYPLLETGWYASSGKPYAKRYGDLCDEFLLTRHAHLSLIRQQLDPPHEELREQRYLERWEYRETVGTGDIIITYYAGLKFFEDQRARNSRRELAERLKPQLSEPIHNPLREEILLADILTVCGDASNTGAYRKAVRENAEDILRMTLSETRQAHLEGRIKKSKGAYFMDTLKWLTRLRVDATGEGANT